MMWCVRYPIDDPASAHPITPCHTAVATPSPGISALSDKYCGAMPLFSVPMEPRESPTKRRLTYGWIGKPTCNSVLICAYEKKSLQRDEYMGYIQTVVRKVSKDGRRLR